MAIRRAGGSINYATMSSEIVFAVCDRFFQNESVSDIAKWVTEERGVSVTREQVYPLLREAQRRNFMWLQPPPEDRLVQRLHDKYDLDTESKLGATPVQVLDVRDARVSEHVAYHAARTALDLIKEIGSKRTKPVHVGLGSGWTTMTIARYLADLMRQELELPSLVLHSLSSGFSVEDPAVSSVAFFNFFHGMRPEVKYVGLFAPPFVPTEDYESIESAPGVVKAFDAKGQIDVVITAFASSDDPHGELTKFIQEGLGEEKRSTLDALRSMAWVGDVQYRPYSAEGPLDDDIPRRAVTLFDLPELVELAAKPKKAVVLVAAGRCRRCGRSRAQALRPLLEADALKVWSHVIMDADTAEQCLA